MNKKTISVSDKSLEILKKTFKGTNNISCIELYKSDLQDKELHELHRDYNLQIYCKDNRYYVANLENKILTELEIQEL